MYSIAQVVKRGLCCGCGTCAAVCPANAIVISVSEQLFVPKIQEDKCNSCQLCVQCCPGHAVDFEILGSKIFGKQPRNKLFGSYLGCYIGHSTDMNVRYNSSSGGIATQLLIAALENDVIDGALVTRMRKDNPWEPEGFIARTREDVISASKSKYCPVAVNTGLKHILKEDGRFAVVGLPCHIHGIRKSEEVFKQLDKKIVLHIGLLCSHVVSFAGSHFLLEKIGVRKEQVTDLSYRGKGWPGSMSVQVKNGSSISMPLIGGWNAYWPIFSSFFFTPMRCMMCPDQASELADISLGDAWLPELKDEKRGESIIVTRTKIGEDILAFASSAKAISVKPVHPNKVEQSQIVNLKFKKGDLAHRLAMLSLFGKSTPTFNPKPTSTGLPVSLMRAFFSYFNTRASSNKRFKSLLLGVPFPIFRLYYGIFKFLSLL
jgi:coenzyme F420 hydrogenase subunit beta